MAYYSLNLQCFWPIIHKFKNNSFSCDMKLYPPRLQRQEYFIILNKRGGDMEENVLYILKWKNNYLGLHNLCYKI